MVISSEMMPIFFLFLLTGYLAIGFVVAMGVMAVWDTFSRGPLTYFFFPRVYIRKFILKERIDTFMRHPPFAVWLGDKWDCSHPEGVTPGRYFFLIICLWPLKFVVDGVLCLLLLPKLLFSRKK